MTKKIPAFLILILLTGIVYSQDIVLTGKLSDKTDKTPVAGTTMILKADNDSTGTVKTVVTDSKGLFHFNALSPISYTLRTSNGNYENISQKINLQASNKTPIEISLTRKAATLGEVVVVAAAPPVKLKGDTTEFSASQFKVNPDATAEDLIRKMPGITVDAAGTVTTLGDQVKKVTVDGRDFFGDDATAALKNLPAEIIDKIQVFDKLSDQAAFTGFDDGNSTKTINIVTKAGMRNGQFGRLYAGYGTDGRYSAGGNVSFFKGNRRISLVGLFNNVNQQNFSSEDLLGVTSSSSGGGGRGGGGRGGRGGGGGNASFGGGGNNFLVGQTNGISSTNAFGINYSDQWSKKLEVTGSYFFNNSNTNNNQISRTQYTDTAAKGNYFDDDTTLSNAKNYNHRANLRMEYKIDEKNFITFTPSISYQKNNSEKQENEIQYYTPLTNLRNSNFSRTNNSSSGYNSNNNLLFRHAFAKRGRTISLNLNASYNHKDGDNYLTSDTRSYLNGGTLATKDTAINQYTDQLVNGNTYSANVSYTEPVGKKGQLQLSYSPSVTKNKSDQEVFQYDSLLNTYSKFDASRTNKFNNTTTSHTTSASYRVGDRDNMFSIGASYKYLELNSDQFFPHSLNTKANFNNVLPNLMWRKKLNAKSNLNIMYRASTNSPSISQLQNYIDQTNPLYLTSGNPNLKQQTSNTVSARYTFTDSKTSKSFFVNLFLQQANNYIANSVYTKNTVGDSTLSDGVTKLQQYSQFSIPVNVNGYLSMRSFVTYSIPAKFIKSTLNFNGGFTYSKTPSLINYLSSISNNYTYNAGLVVASNISQYVDFNLSYNGAFTNTRNTLNTSLNTNYLTQNVRLQANLLSKKGWFIQNDISNISYSGLGATYNQSYWLWNASIGKKFLKNQAGELKLSAFDLLKQNQSITRNVAENYVQDVKNEVLQQYFLLTFTYKLKNFGIAAATNNNNKNKNRNFQGGGPQGGMNNPGF